MLCGVIGAGIVGASAALELARKGHDVTLFEMHPLPHTRGSSHGISRIVRKAYPDPLYTAIMAEAYPMWRDLEGASGETLLHECGLLYFGAENSPRIVEVIASLSKLGVDHEVLGPREVRRVMPSLALDPGEAGVFTPEAGWINADQALAAIIRLACQNGATLRTERVQSLAAMEEEFDGVVVAAGPWIRQFVPALEVKVTRQTVAMVHGLHAGPVWIEDSLTSPYGFPTRAEDESFKVGIHHPGPEFDPDDDSRPIDPAAMAQIAEVARRRFGIDHPEVHSPVTCLYTNTPDEDFRFGQISAKTVWGSFCSGHGFKFGPWSGRLLARLALGETTLAAHPRFAVHAR